MYWYKPNVTQGLWRKGSDAKNHSGCERLEARRQDELIGGKPPVVK
jgi:hypothetical protein